MREHFCTYFDHRYAGKGLAMWRSLQQVHPSATLHVLCLNQACFEILEGLQLAHVHLYALDALEDADPDLRRARHTRSAVEYYFTLTPCVPLHVFRANPTVSRLTYLDADLFFFADPQPVLDEVGDGSVGLIEHRFPDELSDREQFGRFNVGWLTFRNDPAARHCLDTWRAQCIDWCHDRLEPGRFAEQKYLDDWPRRFEGVRIIQHRGANVAPWNLSRFEIVPTGEALTVGGQPLLFFHAHGFQPHCPGQPRSLNLKDYQVDDSAILTRYIFEPYERALRDAITQIATPLSLTLLADGSRDMAALLAAVRAQLSASEADRAARLTIISSLEEQLAASEADRAARLIVIRSLDKQLAASEADRAARLTVIRSLEEQLAATETGRLADRALISAVQADLQASEARRVAGLDAIRTLQHELKARETEGVSRLAVIQNLEAQLDGIEERLRGIETQLGEARARVRALELSRSWRWTRPVRWLVDRLG